MENEKIERTYYRMACKFFLPYSENCSRDSQVIETRTMLDFSGSKMTTKEVILTHISVRCTPDSKCPRLRRYDKLHKTNKEK